ncbi:MAG: hypothetical protein EB078_06370 [Proteobacteria bacterium]|nr:hypothetical protein [Pseudomonadota bacterium]NDD04511.1 hypothetical protein [Pseudomonadota bacterium]NDG26337.1 hypothetical protein [Pseudomonadota bacterium]
MSQLIWRIRELFSKLIAIALVGVVAFGGYTLYRKGAFSGGISHAGKVVMRQIPYFGSRFRHFIASATSSSRPVSYASSRRSYHRKYGRSHRKHVSSHRRHHRSRRHR